MAPISTTAMRFLALTALVVTVAASFDHAAAAAAAAAASDEVPIVIMSDRYLGTATVINSTCAHSADPSKLAFHLITSPEGQAVLPVLFASLEPCEGATLTTMTVADATAQLYELGFHPFWDDASFGDTAKATPEAEWAVRTPYRDDKHADALNHLRFYLPHLPSLAGSRRFVFMDDDIVLQRDVAEFAAFDLAPGKAMAAGCQHWKWTPKGFVTSYDTSMVATGYMGAVDTPCKAGEAGKKQRSCTRPTLMEELKAVGDELKQGTLGSSGKKKPHQQQQLRGGATANMGPHPLAHTAFNMGFNVIDVDTWKDLKLTEHYELWVAASNDRKLFPPDTLAFGLVIAYLALGEAVQCYDDQVTHLVGLAFIPKERLEGEYGWTTQRMREEAFALHFNGSNKPWDADVPECRGADEEQFPAAVDIWRHHCGKFCPCKEHVLATPTAASTAAAVRTARRRLLAVEDEGEGQSEDQSEGEEQDDALLSATPNEYVPDSCPDFCGVCESAEVCTTCLDGYVLSAGGTCSQQKGDDNDISTSPASALQAGSGLALTALVGLCMAAGMV